MNGKKERKKERKRGRNCSVQDGKEGNEKEGYQGGPMTEKDKRK